jgi:hypothetical protein
LGDGADSTHVRSGFDRGVNHKPQSRLLLCQNRILAIAAPVHWLFGSVQFRRLSHRGTSIVFFLNGVEERPGNAGLRNKCRENSDLLAFYIPFIFALI